MLKKYLLIFIAAFALISTSGCSLFSSDSEEPKEDAVAEDTVSDEEVSDSTETTASNSDEEEVVDEYPDDDYGGDDTAVAKTDSATDMAADSGALPDQPVDGTTDTLLVGADEPAAATTNDVTSDAAPVDESASASSSTTVADTYVPTGNFTPVKKMKKTPYSVGGVLMNRLYIARDGDTLKSIAEKTMGDSSRSNELLKWNSSLSGRELKVGDKVYYNSVKNPSDSSQILVYYEEAGIQPSYYTGKAGESLRKTSKKLLGHERSWMEIFATNDNIEDRWQLTEGLQFKYWPAGSAGAPVQAQAAAEPTPQPTPTEEMPAAPDESAAMAMNDSGAAAAATTAAAEPTAEAAPTEAMPEEAPAMNDTGAAAAATTAQAEATAPEATPPPPAAPIEPPAPPAADEEASSGGLSSMMGGEDDSMMMAGLGGLLILAALIMIVFIRRGRKKVNYG